MRLLQNHLKKFYRQKMSMKNRGKIASERIINASVYSDITTILGRTESVQSYTESQTRFCPSSLLRSDPGCWGFYRKFFVDVSHFSLALEKAGAMDFK